MSVNYSELQATATAQIKAAGVTVKFFRLDVLVASSFAMELASEMADSLQAQSTPTSLLAQTSQTRKTLMVAATKKPIENGDVMVRGQDSFTVTKVSDFAPGGVLLFLKVEVI